MRTTGRLLVAGWLLAALLVLALDGRLPEFIAGAGVGSLVVVGVGAVVRHQLAPSRHNRPSLPERPERYQVADDLGYTLAEVIAVAEWEAIAEAPAECRPVGCIRLAGSRKW